MIALVRTSGKTTHHYIAWGGERVVDKELDKLIEKAEILRAKAEKCTASLGGVSGRSDLEETFCDLIDTENLIKDKIKFDKD